MSRIVVVGAGLAGLAAAAVLAQRARTTIVERLPAAGGFAGWDDKTVKRLEVECRRAGVLELLGTTALRWDGARLLVASPGSIRWIPADHIVFAGGTRPATAADLRLTGDRPAGVVSATVAEHLANAGVVLGQSPVVIGVSHWSARVVLRAREHGGSVAVLGLPGDRRPEWGGQWLGTGIPRAIWGHPRVAVLEVERQDGEREHLDCDGVVLGAPARPIRNVEGAVRPRARVTFVQELDLGLNEDMIVSSARASASAIEL